MSPDRSWMRHRFDGIGGITDEYKSGVDNFVEFAQQTKDKYGLIGCPCTKCKNLARITEDELKLHLYKNGIIESYTIWDRHGEKSFWAGHYSTRTSQNHNVNEDGDIYNAFEILKDIGEQYRFNNVEEEPNKEAADFYKLVNDASVPLYPSCEGHSKLSFVTKLLHFKNRYGCSQKGFDELLKLIGSVLPSPHTLPETYQNVKNMVRGLNLGYEKIDVCENDCMLFYKEDADPNKLLCDICGANRYKEQKDPKKARVTKKILRYFPITPRLQRLFMSKHTSEYMRWHKSRDVVEGQIIHPADGDEWKNFDKRFTSFANETRNIRLGLVTDGFQPFHDKYARGYSVWPVFIVVYNLPPFMCMKDQFIIMPLIIPGNKDPTKDLNVYLRPLIDELKLLWHAGVTTFDKSLHSNFVMRAALLWTISDFLAYGMLSGWSTHGRMSCPICVGDVRGFQLKYGGKSSYYGTSRVFFEPNDPLRKNNKYGSKETRSIRTRYSGTSIKNYCQRVKFYPHGKIAWHKPVGFGVTHNWTHKAMFWELPYWETLQLRHCLDVMHTEKNVFDNLFYTIINDGGKTKDNKKSRQDCEHLKIRNELWIRSDGTIPQAQYALTRDKVDKLCKWAKDLELPDGCSSNIARCSKEEKKTFRGLKSHDDHVFLQKLLSIVVRDLLPKSIGDAIIELCNFFKDLCSTTLKRHDLEKMEKDIAKILCKLELIFPSGFFDTMEHLPIHLATECLLGGPVQYRWMYVFERFLHKLKLTVKNKARVEGSMTERYIEEELTNFCSIYFESDVATVHNRLQRNEEIEKMEGQMLTLVEFFDATHEKKNQKGTFWTQQIALLVKGWDEYTQNHINNETNTSPSSSPPAMLPNKRLRAEADVACSRSKELGTQAHKKNRLFMGGRANLSDIYNGDELLLQRSSRITPTHGASLSPELLQRAMGTAAIIVHAYGTDVSISRKEIDDHIQRLAAEVIAKEDILWVEYTRVAFGMIATIFAKYKKTRIEDSHDGGSPHISDHDISDDELLL